MKPPSAARFDHRDIRDVIAPLWLKVRGESAASQARQHVMCQVGTLAAMDNASGARRLDAQAIHGECAFGSSVSREKTILVVDDNAGMREVIVRTFAIVAPGRFEIRAVCDGRSALAAARERLPDLVLTDLEMPIVDGKELVARLRAEYEDRCPPIMLMSGREGMHALAESLGVHALAKPFDVCALVPRLDAIFEALAADATSGCSVTAPDVRQRGRTSVVR